MYSFVIIPLECEFSVQGMKFHSVFKSSIYPLNHDLDFLPRHADQKRLVYCFAAFQFIQEFPV